MEYFHQHIETIIYIVHMNYLHNRKIHNNCDKELLIQFVQEAWSYWVSKEGLPGCEGLQIAKWFLKTHCYGNKSCLHSSDFRLCGPLMLISRAPGSTLSQTNSGTSYGNDSEASLTNGYIHKRDTKSLLRNVFG